ncbi:unnamed protein product [Closterium sp. NIES-54]
MLLTSLAACIHASGRLGLTFWLLFSSPPFSFPPFSSPPFTSPTLLLPFLLLPSLPLPSLLLPRLRLSTRLPSICPSSTLPLLSHALRFFLSHRPPLLPPTLDPTPPLTLPAHLPPLALLLTFPPPPLCQRTPSPLCAPTILCLSHA